MDDVQEEPEEEEEVPEPAPNMKKIVKKGKAPVDELCGLAGTHIPSRNHTLAHCELCTGSHHVYVDGSGVAWDATLNQTDVRA
jgi:poly [ADP-ribose] polymerase 2/3/4